MPPLPYRLVAIDLDDTLLDPNQQLSERNARAVRRIAEQGAVVVLASGRMHVAAMRFADLLELDTPIISYNGAMIKWARSGKIWLHDHVRADLAQTIMDYCGEHSLQLNWYLNDKLYSVAYTSWLQLYEKRTLAPIEVRADFYTALRGTMPTKLVIVDSPEKTDRLRPYFQSVFGDKLYITKSNDEYLEFMPPTSNKGAALALTAERLGLTAADALAFGDSYNDISMLRWAGMGIAVANAKPDVKAAAKRIILSNTEDGVGVALEEIFGLDA